MNIGDKVRLMHGREEGIITRFIGTDQVEVAIDGDFTIPVLRREVVVVSADEAKMFGGGNTVEPTQAQQSVKAYQNPAPAVLATTGVYLALTHQSPELLAVAVVNNTDYDVLFTYGEETNGKYKGISNDRIQQRNFKNVSHLHLKDFEKWPDILLQFILHRSGSQTLLEPALKRVRFKATSFYKSKAMVPVLKKEGYLYQLDSKPIAVDADKIKEQLQETASATENYKLNVPDPEVDLHIEKITDEDFKIFSNSEILRRQLAVFQDNLDRAIAANLPEITFIHGTGNGVLKKEIHKILSRSKEIKFFEDAKKEKFGFGATRVQIH